MCDVLQLQAGIIVREAEGLISTPL